MAMYEARMRVAYDETWSVEADSPEEARKKFEDLATEVITDEAGEVTDWEVKGIKLVKRQP